MSLVIAWKGQGVRACRERVTARLRGFLGGLKNAADRGSRCTDTVRVRLECVKLCVSLGPKTRTGLLDR